MYIHTCMYIHVLAYMHMYCIYIHAYTYTHTHTHLLCSLNMSGTGHMVERHCAFTISMSWDEMNRTSCDFSDLVVESTCYRNGIA